MDELRTSVLEAVKKRFSSPVFGFIFLSWIAFNWDIILFVLLSKKSIEERIKIVQTIPNEVLPNIHYLWPIFIGVILAIGTPYGRLFFNYLHQWAKQKEWQNAFHQEVLVLQQKIGLAEKKVEADNIEELEREKFKTKIQEQKSKQDSFIANIEKMKEQELFLNRQLTELEQKIVRDNNKYKDILNISIKVLEAISEIHEINESATVKEMMDVIKREVNLDDLNEIKEFINMQINVNKDRALSSSAIYHAKI